MQIIKNIIQSIFNNKKRAVIFLSVSFLFVVIIIFSKGCGKSSKFSFKFANIQKGNVSKTISVTGSLGIINEYIVLSKVGGMIQKIYADFNNKVKRGQLLAVIDSTDFDRNLTKVRLHLDNVTINLNNHKKIMKLKEKQYKDGFISKQAYIGAKKAYISVFNGYKSTLIDYKFHLKNKRNTRIISPISGIIINKNLKENAPIGGNHHCYTIAPSLKRMKLVITVDESDIGFMKNGQKVTFTVGAFPNKTFKGSIKQVRMNPIKSGGLVVYQSVVHCENPELLLKPGMTATATVNVAKRKKVLRVLNQAFLVSPIEMKSDIKKKYVWIKSSKKYKNLPLKRIEVKYGLAGDMYTEIKGNLKEGDQVLIKVLENTN